MIDAFSRFLDHYYRRRPVNATFTGMHVYDSSLPDWSPSGLVSLDAELRKLKGQVDEQYPAPESARDYRDDVDLLDAELIRAFCEIQLAENASGHGMRGNPALWTGEAVFSIIALMIREFASLDDRMRAANERMSAIPEFLSQARGILGDRPIPAAWTARALRDCEGADALFMHGVELWITSGRRAPANEALARSASVAAAAAFREFAVWLRARPIAPDTAMACGAALFDLLLRRGHQCARSPADLLADARAHLDGATSTLDAMVHETAGSWDHMQLQLAENHPPIEEYLGAFEHTWRICYRKAMEANLVTWPDWPITYEEIPEWTREAAPFLYYLYYRSPAPLDPYDEYVYVVPPLPAEDPTPHLQAWNNTVIKLNHVVHHGGLGHHVQNWNAYHRANSRVGKIAAVDCANRIGMFSGGTMAEGWACYATELMDELGALSPLERVAEQHSRVRMLARAVVDLSFHHGEMSVDEAARVFEERAHMTPAAALAEVVKCSMFPGTALMYWLGTQGILDLRARVREREGDRFSLKRFHDDLLHYGSIPVLLIARLMTEDVA